ncbi:hypothetical protein ACEWY4_008018 [Coilia grayii]|uniref:TIR domain-containing protein n=1 Tax=Coilia grayii TaxID=363190 RepID=A0ABD1K9S4_9TELE
MSRVKLCEMNSARVNSTLAFLLCSEQLNISDLAHVPNPASLLISLSHTSISSSASLPLFHFLPVPRSISLSLSVSLCLHMPRPDTVEAILHCMQRSRRLLLVLSPAYVQPQSHSLLECHLGLYLHQACQAPLVTVRFRSLSSLGAPCVEVTQLRRFSSSTVAWRGERSAPPGSRFWKLLRLALPVRPLALGKRLIDSSSTHSDLAVLARLGQQGAPNALSGSDKPGQGAAGKGRGASKRNMRRAERWRERQRQLAASESCTVCVSFRESRVSCGTIEPMWKTHLHQPIIANGMPVLPDAVSCPLTVVVPGSQEPSPQPSNSDQDNNNSNNSQMCELRNSPH